MAKHSIPVWVSMIYLRYFLVNTLELKIGCFGALEIVLTIEKKMVYVFTYMISSLWDVGKPPDKYLKTLYDYKYVLSPDFSLYTDFPMALQIYNHYRKHWLARYWQEHYINVIPTICWSTEESFDWCFDGEPKHSTLAVSSQSCLSTEEKKQLFIKGYNEMLRRLEPECLIFYGDTSEEVELPSRVVRVDTFSNKCWK